MIGEIERGSEETGSPEAPATWPPLVVPGLLLAFVGYFTWDILTLRRALHHADIFTYYYPFRQWFAAQIRGLHFPVWNPYWGVGHGAEVWASIPLDFYTPLEVLVGPYYHWYQALQLAVLLGAVTWVFHRLGAPLLLAATSSIVFFMMPMVTHWFFSFLIVQIYIAHALLFAFIWEWSRTGHRRYLFLIAATTAAGMLGTKVEFWFYQTIFSCFLAVVLPWLEIGRPGPAARRAAPALFAVAAGIVANAWQLNILLRLIAESGRLSEQGPANLLQPRLYRHLLVSVADSPLWQLVAAAALLWLVAAGPRRARVPGLVGLAALGWLLWQAGAVSLGFAAVADLPNASLERWIEGPAGRPLPEHFSLVANGPGCVIERAAIAPNVRDGAAAALLRAPTAGNCFLRTELTPTERFRGRRVRVAVWVRAGGVVGDAVQVDLQDGRGAPTLLPVPGGDGWRRIQLERQVAPDAPFLLVTLNVTDRATGPVLVDGLEVQVARARPAWSRREYGISEILATFGGGPVLPGALLGLLLGVVLIDGPGWRGPLRIAALFAPFVFYWCRPAPGELDETRIIGAAPWAFQAMLAALVWLGCGYVGRKRLATAAWTSVLFVLVMRDQGQIVLAWLAGFLWLPSRDNYIIDFAVALLAITGLGGLALAAGARGAQRIATVLAAAAVVVTVGSAWSNPYYSQPLMRPAPSSYPFYQGVPELRRIFAEIRTSPADRVYLANYDARGFTYGFGEALLEGVGQVTMYSSLTSQRYKDWTIFHQLGIRPEQHWAGYPGGYSPAMIARLPRKETLGHSNETYYHHTIIARPPLRAELLDLLGVTHVLKLHPVVSAEAVAPLAPGQVDREIAALRPVKLRRLDGIAEPGLQADLAVAELAHAMPRAWVVRDVTPRALAELQTELDPRLADGMLVTRSHRLPVGPATLVRYEAEHVTVTVETDREAVLVLGDLFHPFWSATLDGTPAEIFPALHVFRGVLIPPGRHAVEFRCRVPLQGASVALSLLVIATGAVFWARIGRAGPS